MKPSLSILLALGLLAASPPPAAATARYYPDLCVKSDNGQFVVEAKSPDNAAKDFAVFQDDFRYVLKQASRDQVIWSWKPDKEPSPVALFVDDTGWVVVWNAIDEFVVVSPIGVAKTVCSMSSQVPQAEYERWIHETTAGPEWAGLSLHYFCSSGDELFFTIRTFWDRRIIINLRERKPAVVTPAISEILDAAERRTVMTVLTLASGKKFVDDHDGSVDFDVQTAAFVAGKLGIQAAVPLLLQLEQLATEPSSSTYVIDGLCYKENRPRQIAQLSLRRLGVSSNDYPATFVEIAETRPAWKIPFHFANTTRAKAANRIAVGGRVEDVTRILGYPDYLDDYHVRGIGDDDSVWEYDIDSAEPFTLRLIIHRDAITKIERLAPLWKTTGIRDELLAH